MLDTLGKVLLGVGLVLAFCTCLSGDHVIECILPAWLGMSHLYAYFRMFSRNNVRKRYDENVRFLNKT